MCFIQQISPRYRSPIIQPDHCANGFQVIQKEVQQVLDKNISPQENKRSVFCELRDNANLPPSKKNLTRLEQEGTLFAMVGTRPTAKSIGIARYHLAANSETMQLVRSELRAVPDSASRTKPEQLPYLSAVIAQANRVSFGVTARVCRIAPDEDLRCQNIRYL